MQNILKSVNFREGVLPVHSRFSFDLELLSQILMRQNDKFNLLYTKHFYGFEKEQGNQNYRDGKNIVGTYFNYRYPVLESKLPELQKLINQPISDVSKLLPKSDQMLKKEAEEAMRLEERIKAMDPKEKRKYD